MLLFTDGLIEARSPVGSFIDPAPLLPVAGRTSFDAAPEGLLDSLTQAADYALDDDLALLPACYDPQGRECRIVLRRSRRPPDFSRAR